MGIATNLDKSLRWVESKFLDDQCLRKTRGSKLAELVATIGQLPVRLELVLGQLARHLLAENRNPVLVSLEIVDLTPFEQLLVDHIESPEFLLDAVQFSLVTVDRLLVQLHFGNGRNRDDTGVFDRATPTGAVSADVAEERKQPVVVLLGNRINLVVVATSTTNRETKKDLSGRAEDVVKVLETRLLDVNRFILPDPQPIIPGGNLAIGGHRVQFIPGKLLGRKTVERLVTVEGPDHIITVSPDMRLRPVTFVAVGLGVANQVEPVAAPLLSVVRGLEQAVHNFCERSWGIVGQERIDLPGHRRQPGQVIRCAAQQRGLVRRT